MKTFFFSNNLSLHTICELSKLLLNPTIDIFNLHHTHGVKYVTVLFITTMKRINRFNNLA